MATDGQNDDAVENDEEVIVIEETDAAPEVDNSETVVEAPDAVVEANPTIIVETPAEETVSDSEIDRAVDTAERLTALEGVVGGLVERVAELGYQTESAQSTAEVALDVAVETVEEVQEVAEEVEADEPPSDSGSHWWFESREDRKKRKGKV